MCVPQDTFNWQVPARLDEKGGMPGEYNERRAKRELRGYKWKKL